MEELHDIVNLKRSLLGMHPKFEALPDKNPALLEAAHTPAVPVSIAATASPICFHLGPQLSMQFGMTHGTHSRPIFGMDLGLFQPQLSKSQSALSRRENEKEQIRHSTKWISKKEMHLCR